MVGGLFLYGCDHHSCAGWAAGCWPCCACGMPAGPIARAFSQLGLTQTAAVSPTEVAVGQLGAAKLAFLTESFARDGVIVLGAVISAEALDALRGIEDSNTVRQIIDPGWSGKITPHRHPGVLPQTVDNPVIEQVVAALLGVEQLGGAEIVSCSVYGGGGRTPGTDEVQDIHCDNHWDWAKP